MCVACFCSFCLAGSMVAIAPRSLPATDFFVRSDRSIKRIDVNCPVDFQCSDARWHQRLSDQIFTSVSWVSGHFQVADVSDVLKIFIPRQQVTPMPYRGRRDLAVDRRRGDPRSRTVTPELSRRDVVRAIELQHREGRERACRHLEIPLQSEPLQDFLQHDPQEHDIPLRDVPAKQGDQSGLWASTHAKRERPHGCVDEQPHRRRCFL